MKRLCKTVVIAMCIFSFLSLFGCNKNKYIVDGPDMERKAEWISFTISQTSDVYEGNFAYTVTKDEQDGLYYLFYDYFDYENKVPEERKVRLKDKTVNALLEMKLLSLPDVEPKETSGEEIILDGTWAKLTITDDFGNTYEKSISDEMVGNIRSLLTPYAEDVL